MTAMFDRDPAHDQATLINNDVDVMLSIDQDATLYITTDQERIALTPSQVLALGDFLHQTESLWRP